MKNVINYYYNLYPENIFQNEEGYYFFIDDIRYSLIKYEDDIDKINEIYSMHQNMLSKNIYVHPIILNKDLSSLTFVSNKPYILFQILNQKNNISIDDIISFTKIPAEEKNINWGDLWSKKNDYLEFQMSELGKKHPILRDSFSYFIGLGETAIAIVNTIQLQEHETVYAHKRINNKMIDLYSPMNITIDLKVRDIAEYFKQKIFKGQDIEEELTYYFNNTRLSTYEYMMFLARMIYPTPYFDIYEEIITDKKGDREIINIIDKAQDYENIIKKIYHYLKTFINIMPIEWLE